MATILDIVYASAVNGTAYDVVSYIRVPHGPDAADPSNPYVVATDVVDINAGVLRVKDGNDANWSLAGVSFGGFGDEDSNGFWDASQGCATVIYTFTTGALDDVSIGPLLLVQKEELLPDAPYPLKLQLEDNGDDTWTLRLLAQGFDADIEDDSITFTRAELEDTRTAVRAEWQCGTPTLGSPGFDDVAHDGFIRIYWNGALILNKPNLDLYLSDDQDGPNWANGFAIGYSGLMGNVERVTLNDTLCSATSSERNALFGYGHTVQGSDDVIAGRNGSLIADRTVLLNLDGTARSRSISGALDLWGDFYINGVLQAGGSGVSYQHRIVVAKSGGDFTSIQDAIDSISDASATNRYLIEIMPGSYAEQVTMQSWVDLRGASKHTVRIEFGATDGALKLADWVQVEDILFELTATEGHWAIVGDNTSNWHIRNCDFLASVNTKRGAGIKVTGTSWNTGFIEHCVINTFTQTNQGIYLDSDGVDLADVTINDVFVDSFEATTGGSILLDNLLDSQLRSVFARTSSSGYCVRITGTSGIDLCGCWLEFGTTSLEVTGGTVQINDSAIESYANSGGTLRGTWTHPGTGVLVGGFYFVRKASDESVSSSTTLQADNELLFPVGAGETWDFDFNIHYLGNTTGDFRCGLKFPTSPTQVQYGIRGPAATATGDPDFIGDQNVRGGFTADAVAGMPLGATTVQSWAQLKGFIRNGANAGNVVLWWAQGTSDGTNTTVKAGSWLTARRIQ